MIVSAIDHVQIAIPAGGEDRARAFYGNLLGLGEVPKPPKLAKRGGAWFENENVKVHIGIDSGFKPAKKAHVCFVVDDIEDLSGLLLKDGFAVRPDDEIENLKRIFTDDPFGNRIEIMESAQ